MDSSEEDEEDLGESSSSSDPDDDDEEEVLDEEEQKERQAAKERRQEKQQQLDSMRQQCKVFVQGETNTNNNADPEIGLSPASVKSESSTGRSRKKKNILIKETCKE